jgi:signal transduction histidine kinase
MFARARRRLALRYVGLFMLVLVIFSAAFLAVMAIVLRPSFDLAPELPSNEAARQAYATTLEIVAAGLLVGDLAVVGLVAAAAFYLAGRTLRPIQQALLRQRRFVADASHDLRNPLAAMRATAEAALANDADPEAAVQALRSVVASSARLASLTSDLLLMANAEQDLQPDLHEETDLSVAVAEAVEQLRPSHAGAEIVTELSADLGVRASHREVGRIVTNLVDNALRYGEGRAVQVVTRERAGEALLEVTDHGSGIAQSDLDHLFDPFYRARSDAAGPSGNGLGLAIANELARRNGGRLSVTTNLGSGSTFRLHLPRFR